METCFNYCDKDWAFFSSDERKWINRISKLAEQYPDDVIILAQPKDNDGCIYAKLRQLSIKFVLKPRRRYTDEQILALKQRALNLQKNNGKIGNSEKA